MTRPPLFLLLSSKALRSFYNGVFSSFLIYYYFAAIKYEAPISIPLTFSAVILSGALKSKLIAYVNGKGVLRSLLLTYFFYLTPLLIINYFLLKGGMEGIVFMILFIVGFFPVDGQDIILFERVEKEHLSISTAANLIKETPPSYSKMGFIFQAVGSLSSFLYMGHDLEAVNFVEEVRVRQIFIAVTYLSLINITFYTVFALWKKAEPTESAHIDNEVRQIDDRLPNGKRLRVLSAANGFSYGLLSAPFLAYFSDLKLNFYHDRVGLLLSAFFLLKGVGKEYMRKHSAHDRLLKWWYVAASLSLGLIGVFPGVALSVLCLVLAFPLWNYGGAMLKRHIDSRSISVETAQLSEELPYWERSGAALGVFVSAFSFSIIYSEPHFGYAFPLCGLVRLISFALMRGIPSENESKVLNKETEEDSIQIHSELKQFYYKVSSDECYESHQRTGNKQFIKKAFVCMFLIILFTHSAKFYASTCHYAGTCQRLRTKGDKFAYSVSLRLFNESLAHYLLRDNISNVKLVNCDQRCVEQHRGRGEHYEKLNYGEHAEWLHFPEMRYHTTEQQFIDDLASIALLNASTKGFSIMWANPLLYNKIPDRLHAFFAQFPERYGFHYAEMPSLNLRGVENKVLFIFRRTQRLSAPLPPFVRRQPPRNYLAIETTFKMITNYRYLREYILYHLNLGFDKFFLYNNDQVFNSSIFYNEFRGSGNFTSKCFNVTFDEEYGTFQEIWQDFYDHIIYIPWRIGTDHAKGEAHLNYDSFFKYVVKFTCFTDLDEFVYSPTGKYLPDTLQGLLIDRQVTALQLISRNFKSRLCTNKQLAIQIFRWMYEPYNRLTIKTILMTKMAVDHSVHEKASKNGAYAFVGDSRHDFKLIHYKITSTHGGYTEDSVWDTDQSMKGYIKQMKDSCNGKCSDTAELTCSEAEYKRLMNIFCRE